MTDIEQAVWRDTIERIIGPDEPFAHDPQVVSCMCHKPNQLYAMVNQRNLVRAGQRQRMEQELNKL